MSAWSRQWKPGYRGQIGRKARHSSLNAYEGSGERSVARIEATSASHRLCGGTGRESGKRRPTSMSESLHMREIVACILFYLRRAPMDQNLLTCSPRGAIVRPESAEWPDRADQPPLQYCRSLLT